MSALFYLDKDKKAALHPDAIRIMPSFSILSDEEILFMILYADYNSPYRQFPEHQRRQKAIWHAFEDNYSDKADSPRMKAAIEDYIALQWSPKIKAAEDYQKKIDDLLAQLQDAKNPGDIKKIDEAIDICRKRIRMFEQEYEIDMQKQGVIKGKMDLSFIEKRMSSPKQYQAIIKQDVKIKT